MSNEFKHKLVAKVNDGKDDDILRGKIIIISELLGMAESIKNADKLEKENQEVFDRLDKELG